ncbi:hypothetical protein G6F68_014694 [Rhizopus microsporus]|nr:hypothetical protein G6F68_014694 [Rhizopus microsporus]
MWFGWSGKSVREGSGTLHTQKDGDIEFVTLDLSKREVDGYYNGFANRTLWPLLHFRLDLVDYDPRPAAARGRHRLDPRLPPDPARCAAARTRHRLPHRLLPAHPDALGRPAAGHARSPAAVLRAVCLRPGRLPDPARRRPPDAGPGAAPRTPAAGTA